MPTIIDSLLVELGLDSAKFDRGRRDVDTAFKKTKEGAAQIAKDIEGSGKKSAAFFTQLKKEAAELFIVFEAAKGLKNFVADLKDSNAALGRSAKTLDMSTESLSIWQAVAKMTGGTAEGITGVMQGLAQATQEFMLTGQSSILPYMRTLHLTFADLKDLRKIADSVQGMDPVRAKALLRGLGIGDESTINLLISGRREIQRLYDEAAKLGAVTKEDTKAAQDWQEATERLSTEIHRLGTVVATFVTPAVKAFNDRLIVAIENSKKYTEQDWEVLKPKWEAVRNWWDELWRGNDTTYQNFITNIKNSGPDVLSAYKQAFTAVFDWLKDQFNAIWTRMFGHKIFEGAVGGPVSGPVGTGAGAGATGDNRNWWQRRAPKFLGGKEPPTIELPPAPGRAGTYRPIYKLSGADVSDKVVNTIAGEAVASNQRSVDAVVNNMMNRLGTKAYGSSGNLEEVARAPGQYAGYRQATDKEAAFIRERIRTVASGKVPDITGGSNEYRASSYRGPWFMRHAEAADVGGNRFARNANVSPGTYAPYENPLQKIISHAARLRLMHRSQQDIKKHSEIMQNAHVAMLQDSHATHDNSKHSSAVSVGNVNIHTAATDAHGIAADMRVAMERGLLTNQANYGLA